MLGDDWSQYIKLLVHNCMDSHSAHCDKLGCMGIHHHLYIQVCCRLQGDFHGNYLDNNSEHDDCHQLYISHSLHTVCKSMDLHTGGSHTLELMGILSQIGIQL